LIQKTLAGLLAFPSLTAFPPRVVRGSGCNCQRIIRL